MLAGSRFAIWICSVCDLRGKGPAAWMKHARLHPPERPLPVCEVCRGVGGHDKGCIETLPRYRRFYLRRRAAGLCGKCPRKALPGRARCREHRR